MEKFCRTAKILDKVFSVMFWLVAGVSAVVIVFGLLLIFAKPSFLFENLSVTLMIGNLEFALANQFYPENVYIYVWSIGIVLFFIGAVLTCYGLNIIRKILVPMKNGRPFNPTVSINLKKLGWFSLFYGILSGIVKCIGNMILLHFLDLSQLFVDEKIISFGNSYVMDVSFIIVAAILFLLSYIFRYGEELQQFSDETL